MSYTVIFSLNYHENSLSTITVVFAHQFKSTTAIQDRSFTDTKSMYTSGENGTVI